MLSAVLNVKRPVFLHTSPMAFVFPLCGAKPGHDCKTVSRIPLPLVHVARIKTAAARYAATKRGRRPTRLVAAELLPTVNNIRRTSLKQPSK